MEGLVLSAVDFFEAGARETHNFLKCSFEYPIKNFFLEVSKYSPPFGIIQFFSTCSGMLENIFPKKYKFQRKALFIEIFNCFRENISKLSNYFHIGTFFAKVYFSSKFFVRKKKKNFFQHF